MVLYLDYDALLCVMMNLQLEVGMRIRIGVLLVLPVVSRLCDVVIELYPWQLKVSVGVCRDSPPVFQV